MFVDADDRLTVSTADEVAQRRSGGRVRIRFNGAIATLWREGRRETVHLLPYQLTEQGIADAIAENEPWSID